MDNAAHGNVWEWTWDFAGGDRVYRGGSWRDGAGDCRAALRAGDAPGNRYSCLGLRPARSPGP